MSGALKKRSFALESAMARVAWEASGRVRFNVLLRDLNLSNIDLSDGRRIEVICDELPLFHGRQLAIDIILISSLRCNGAPHPNAADLNRVYLERARRLKESIYPEFEN